MNFDFLIIVLFAIASFVLMAFGFLMKPRVPFFMVVAGILWIFLFVVTDNVAVAYDTGHISAITPTTITTSSSGLTPIAFHDYSNSTLWTQTGTQVTISSGTLNFATTQGGSTINRQAQVAGLSATLNDTAWKAEFDFKWTAQANGGNFHLVCLTAGQNWFSDTGVSQDGLCASYNFSVNGRLFINAQDGTTLTNSALIAPINLGSTYYVTLERTSATNAKLSVFSDSARTIHVSGSPITFTIPNTLTTLTNIQHTNNKGDGTGNTFTGTVDNLRIYNYQTFTVATTKQIYTYANATAIYQDTGFTQNGARLKAVFLLFGVSFMLVGALEQKFGG